jgi:hypothetical protein
MSFYALPTDYVDLLVDRRPPRPDHVTETLQHVADALHRRRLRRRTKR